MHIVDRRSWIAVSVVWFAICSGHVVGDERLLENDVLDGPPASLVRADKFLANGQDEDAIQVIRQIMEDEGGRLVGVSSPASPFKRYIPLRSYCHWRLAQLATEKPSALALYRSQVDPLAERWLQQAIEAGDSEKLVRIIDQLFASSFGDDALLHLGEHALQRGQFARARFAWQQISPDLPTEKTAQRLVYPDPTIDAANVHARLCLVSILAGRTQQAADELELLSEKHPQAAGRIAGRDGVFVDSLNALLEASKEWPARHSPDRDWPTLGGAASRFRIANGSTDIALRPIWKAALPKRRVPASESDVRVHRPAEHRTDLVGYHPIVVGGEVIIDQGETEAGIVSLDLQTGKQNWSTGHIVEPGPMELQGFSQGIAGVQRYTMSAQGDTLLAKVGSPITGFGEHVITSEDRGILVGLDRPADGKVLFTIELTKPLWDERWSFDGPPIADRDNLYVALRRVEAGGARAYVACFDLRGRLKWRSGLIAQGESRTLANRNEITTNLVSLRHGTVYFNSNLGAVAAIDAATGATEWITRYPTATIKSDQYGRVGKFFLRDLNPVLVYRDQAIVAPSDCEHIFALDTNTGHLLWKAASGFANDVVHLLGVSHDQLVCSGDFLYWIDINTGKAAAQFPWSGDSDLRGYGRGLIVDDQILWPTRDELYIFDGSTAKLQQQPKNLAQAGATGGNLLLVDGVLLIAAADKIYAFNNTGQTTIDEGPKANDE